MHKNYALKNIGHRARLGGTANDLHRELSRIGKNAAILLVR